MKGVLFWLIVSIMLACTARGIYALRQAYSDYEWYHKPWYDKGLFWILSLGFATLCFSSAVAVLIIIIR